MAATMDDHSGSAGTPSSGCFVCPLGDHLLSVALGVHGVVRRMYHARCVGGALPLHNPALLVFLALLATHTTLNWWRIDSESVRCAAGWGWGGGVLSLVQSTTEPTAAFIFRSSRCLCMIRFSPSVCLILDLPNSRCPTSPVTWRVSSLGTSAQSTRSLLVLSSHLISGVSFYQSAISPQGFLPLGGVGW